VKKALVAALLLSGLYELSIPIIVGVQSDGFNRFDPPPPSSLDPWIAPMFVCVFVLGLLTVAAFVITLRDWDQMARAEKWLVAVPALPALVTFAWCLLLVGAILLALWIFNAGRWSGGGAVLVDSHRHRVGTVDAYGTVRDEHHNRIGEADGFGVVRDPYDNPVGEIKR
jgi:hypothetical protein